MRSRRSLAIAIGLAVVGGACTSGGAGGPTSTGGQPGSATGGRAAGGSTATTGGAPGSTGGTPGSTGGAPGNTGGSTGNTGGVTAPGTGGASGAAGRTGPGGQGGAAGAHASGSGGTTNPGTGGSASPADGGVTGSAGCGKTRTLQNGTINLTTGGAARNYILRAPDGYDSHHPYRLVIAYAWSGASSSQVASSNYFTFSTLDSKNTIFVAPNAADGAGTWSKTDLTFTDAILAQVEGDLCIDTSRVFASGFSFGGGMAIAIACTRADVFRAVAFFSGADLTGACPTGPTKPIAYYASQASQDHGSLPADSPIAGEVIQAEFAKVNGCTAAPAAATFPASGQPHTCTHYAGCSADHPTEFCVFNGPHGWDPTDPGQSTSWDPPEAWKFLTQF
ncbi:MAG TPA: hypothetical protein VN962_05695 [Polyangia bacterium]|nr:hypothetical protein [Polyangia bacterium]